MFIVGATLTACVSVDLAAAIVIFVHIFMQNVTYLVCAAFMIVPLSDCA